MRVNFYGFLGLFFVSQIALGIRGKAGFCCGLFTILLAGEFFLSRKSRIFNPYVCSMKVFSAVKFLYLFPFLVVLVEHRNAKSISRRRQ